MRFPFLRRRPPAETSPEPGSIEWWRERAAEADRRWEAQHRFFAHRYMPAETSKDAQAAAMSAEARRAYQTSPGRAPRRW